MIQFTYDRAVNMQIHVYQIRGSKYDMHLY